MRIKGPFTEIDKFISLGRSGCGKSYLGKTIQEYYPRKIIVDTLYEYEKGPKDFEISDISTLIAVLIELKNNQIKKFTIIYRFALECADKEPEFDEICKLVFNFKDILLVVEEVHLFCSPQYLPLWFENLIRMGRHQKVALLCTSQRPGSVNKNLLAQSTWVFCGQLIDKNDIVYTSSFLNQDAKKLASLPDRTFIQFHNSKINVIENNAYKK